MPRLNDRAYDILRTEIYRLAGDNLVLQVQRDIVLRRLERMRLQNGEPATQDDLWQAVQDIYPDFSNAILRQAAQANRATGFAMPFSGLNGFGRVKLIGLSLLGLVGGLYILNLPYPMIRRPVASTAPILLLPSFISMDYNYRQAISLVEQADQLVNQATGPADLELGTEKVTQAASHLNKLPVWFLGYEPRRYCSFWGCSWQFTLDEFQAARASIGRMEAKVFQETNAQTLLQQGDGAISTARQQYQQSQLEAERSEAIAAWQSGIDLLHQIPAGTLASRMAQPKLVAYERDYEQVAGRSAGGQRANTWLEAAQGFAQAAVEAGQNPPHPASQWQEAARLWEMAIARLENVPIDDNGYLEAQRLLASYESNLGQIRIRIENERTSTQALEQAKAEIERLVSIGNISPQQVMGQLQSIINRLQTVQPNTTVYAEAQTLLQSAEARLAQMQ